jgi:hypothetical protein
LAQNPNELFEKAPPDVDEALRARIEHFYQAHVDGKFRLADEVVAEESKDIFFAQEKKRCASFEIVKITYLDGFQRAKALATCETDVAMAGRVFRMKVPMPTSWKVIDGQWFWYREPMPATVDTPWGKMLFGQGPEAAAASLPAEPKVSVESVISAVTVDKSEVRLGPGELSATVAISNSLPGTVRIRLRPEKIPGLKLELDRREIKSGATARMEVRYEPFEKAAKPPLTVQVIVSPTGQAIPIRVTFTP